MNSSKLYGSKNGVGWLGNPRWNQKKHYILFGASKLDMSFLLLNQKPTSLVWERLKLFGKINLIFRVLRGESNHGSSLQMILKKDECTLSTDRKWPASSPKLSSIRAYHVRESSPKKTSKKQFQDWAICFVASYMVLVQMRPRKTHGPLTRWTCDFNTSFLQTWPSLMDHFLVVNQSFPVLVGCPM